MALGSLELSWRPYNSATIPLQEHLPCGLLTFTNQSCGVVKLTYDYLAVRRSLIMPTILLLPLTAVVDSSHLHPDLSVHTLDWSDAIDAHRESTLESLLNVRIHPSVILGADLVRSALCVVLSLIANKRLGVRTIHHSTLSRCPRHRPRVQRQDSQTGSCLHRSHPSQRRYYVRLLTSSR